jgi:hypothetical protein
VDGALFKIACWWDLAPMETNSFPISVRVNGSSAALPADTIEDALEGDRSGEVGAGIFGVGGFWFWELVDCTLTRMSLLDSPVTRGRQRAFIHNSCTVNSRTEGRKLSMPLIKHTQPTLGIVLNGVLL